MVVPFRVTIPPERQDRHLTAKLKEELPGIFNWALAGFLRLQRNGHFTSSAICQQALDDYREEGNPAQTFLREVCADRAGAKVECSKLYKRYVGWCVDNSFDALDARQFGKEVRRAFPAVVRERGKAALGRPWTYRGLSCVS